MGVTRASAALAHTANLGVNLPCNLLMGRRAIRMRVTRRKRRSAGGTPALPERKPVAKSGE